MASEIGTASLNNLRINKPINHDVKELGHFVYLFHSHLSHILFIYVRSQIFSLLLCFDIMAICTLMTSYRLQPETRSSAGYGISEGRGRSKKKKTKKGAEDPFKYYPPIWQAFQPNLLHTSNLPVRATCLPISSSLILSPYKEQKL
jgi:hypothetical protein